MLSIDNLRIAIICADSDDESDEDGFTFDEDLEPKSIRTRIITLWEPAGISALDFGSGTDRMYFERGAINPLAPQWLAAFVLETIRAHMIGGPWVLPTLDHQQLTVWIGATYLDGDENEPIVPRPEELARLAEAVGAGRAHVADWLSWAQQIAAQGDEDRLSPPGPPRTAENPPELI